MLCLALALLSAGCAPKGVAPKRTVLAGCFIAPDGAVFPTTVFLNTSDPFAPKCRMAARVSPSGEFRFVLPTAFTTVNYLMLGNNNLDLLLSPGDSIYLAIDLSRKNENISEWIDVTGSHVETNKALLASMDLRRGLFKAVPSAGDDIQEYLTQYRAYRSAAADSLKSWQLPDEVCEYVLSLLDMSRTWNNEYDRKTWNKVYTDPTFDLFNLKRGALSGVDYNVALQYFVGGILTEEERTSLRTELTLPVFSAVAERLDADKRIDRALRDYILFQWIEARREYNGNRIPPELASCFIDPAYAARVQTLANAEPAYGTVEVPEILRRDAAGHIDTLRNVEVLRMLAERHPNKVIYIDFYATWCGGCRDEFKQSIPQLRAHYADCGDVCFVTLCLKSRTARWLELLKNYELETYDENYFLCDEASMIVMSEYDLPGFPTYALIGRDGRIATLTAPRPSSFDRVTAAIDALLAEQQAPTGEK